MTVVIKGLTKEDVIGLRATFRENVTVLPPHGRLIDADSLVADIKGQEAQIWRLDAVSESDYFIERNEKFRQSMFKSWCESTYAYLNTRPTIIEAEEGKG